MCLKYEIVVQLPSSSAHAGALVVSVDAGSRKIIAMVQRERRIERITRDRFKHKTKKQLTFSSRGAFMDHQRVRVQYTECLKRLYFRESTLYKSITHEKSQSIGK